jgi:hypothetical protein
MSTLMSYAEYLENTWLGTAIAEGRYAVPLIEGVHLIGLAVAVGLILLVDLRLIGVFLTDIPVKALHRQLQPYVFAGFGVVVIAGVLLFFCEASTVIVSPPWPFKAFFFVLGGANALYFEFITSRRVRALPDKGPLPPATRYAGYASLTLWVLVIICGRLIPYIPHWA